ncbi:alpha/beta fold hydrolase [Cellulomonas marina]|uniref:Pimeloyl-ACP methyl ester carboxylesterase n=1 Tax=Cellulomonas marina TaxID=988821 RepID=A0A1I0WT73_9CELL|nr:alpha/beta hydrolase [Cellulomonas marina]GIG30329.1 hydrolase [Cellulomonas marina]SFA91962.1 Pimeloyl-ACP methyl ester carboxylesterase [Cellulomonas marina]
MSVGTVEPVTAVDSATLLVEGPWRHRFVPANGSRFHVALAGPEDHDAPLVVLLHGVPQYWWAWRHQLPALAAAGYRVAAMDVRGTGGSDKPPQGYDVPTLATDVAGVVGSLGADRAVVVGAGTGGEIAWGMTAFQPGVLRGVAVLGAPHPLDSRRTPGASLRPSAVGRLAFVQLPSLPERAMTSGDLVARLLDEWGGVPGWPDAATLEAYRRAARVPFAAHSQLEQLRWLLRSGVRPDGARYVARLREAAPLPVLQLHGTRDGLRSSARAPLSSAAAAVVGGRYRYEVLPGVGHFLAEQAPARVTALLLEWLRDVSPVG